MTRKGDQSDAGFTLTEVLVVLSVVGIMSGLMLAMTGQFRNLLAADRRISQQAALQKTADHIATLLEKAEPLPLELTAVIPARFMQSTETGVEFVAVARAGAFTFGLSEISVALTDVNGLMQLTQTNSPRRLQQNRTATINTVLSEEVNVLAFTFLSPPTSDGATPEWQPEWQTPASLPLAIKVQLGTKTGRGDQLVASSFAYLNR